MHEIREVWVTNVVEEMKQIGSCLIQYPLISIDTEFPGFLCPTPRNASEAQRYEDMKSSVEQTKLIQFGFTLFDDKGNIGGTWEVNFSNFGETCDARNSVSIDFLRRNGLNFKKIKEDGIDVYKFFGKFFYLLSSRWNLEWVTFHGMYDLAYLVNIIAGSLPETAREFADTVGKTFGRVYDLKDMARKHGLGHHLGLEKLARKLGIQRIGSAHHAGSDSLLTALAFLGMIKVHKDAKTAGGFIYGISTPLSQISDPQMSSKDGALVSYHQMSYDHSALVSYPQLCYNNSGALVSFPQILYNGYTNYDPQIFYNSSSCFDPWVLYGGVSVDPSYSIAAYINAQTRSEVSSNYDNRCYVQE